ncbi:hypothetical protein E1281_01145 [Actinomadura sp. KC345]|uniref:hypothetical protein n=1 Tax=Actinomadura sp. KC345 TaxID=2530371 RepID=UPI001052D163|nr:hypothetical protein [Actinomadura sp. KC345]TDC58585.1 hypothetical protein E1281_01145 [Actinomadura sp. KC345]
MTELAAGTLVQALDYPPTRSGDATAATGNIVFTAYSPSTAVCTFIAPTTGRVMVAIAAEVRDNTSTNYVRHSVRLVDDRTGDVVVGPDAYARGYSSIGAAADWETRSRVFLVQGLEPGASYTATVMYRVEGESSADQDSISVAVWPAT